MLMMKPGCECCDVDLPPDSTDAMICSFECTFCRHCATSVLRDVCPNCGGNLQSRPTRAAELLERYPAATERTFNPRHAQ